MISLLSHSQHLVSDHLVLTFIHYDLALLNYVAGHPHNSLLFIEFCLSLSLGLSRFSFVGPSGINFWTTFSSCLLPSYWLVPTHTAAIDFHLDECENAVVAAPFILVLVVAMAPAVYHIQDLYRNAERYAAGVQCQWVCGDNFLGAFIVVWCAEK